MTKTCDRCGDEYEFYLVLIRDNISDIVEYTTAEYENLCKPCRAALHPNQPFAGADKVTPKHELPE
jgi:hypothetical protein